MGRKRSGKKFKALGVLLRFAEKSKRRLKQKLYMGRKKSIYSKQKNGDGLFEGF